MILLRDLLRAQMFFDGDRIVRPALDRCIVRDDDARAPLDLRDPRDDPRCRRVVVVKSVRGEGREFEKRREGIRETIDSFARGQLAALAMPLHCGFAASFAHACELRT